MVMTRVGSIRPASIHCCSRPRFRGSRGIANLEVREGERSMRICETDLGNSPVDGRLATNKADVRTVLMKEHLLLAQRDTRI